MMEMIKTALGLNPKNRLVAFLWHQGETDATLNSDFQTYYNNLTTLVTNVRKTFGCDNLPFVAGDFVSHWKMENIKRCEPVISAMKEVCKTIGDAEFVETSELLSNDQKIGNKDNIHFCRDALYLLGLKYYDAYQKISAAK
jgi:hypothetical protein